ncbi:hypothetical protein [Kribbella catacumbae]|uniref:hypothetical protein n=1 Tax=Kribbella catacumbae TaxID=460086 RepID=UPI00036AF5E7|nr:hypothetical protein [Kribbella catacumbae]
MRYQGSKAAAVLAAGLLTAGVVAGGGTAAAAPTAGASTSTDQAVTAGACTVSAGGITTGGDHRIQTFAMTSPLSRTSHMFIAKGIYPDGLSRLSSTIRYGDSEVGDDYHSGAVVMGSGLYDSSYLTPPGGGTASQQKLTRVGGGWDNFRAFEHTTFTTATRMRQTEYGLRKDGTMLRWDVRYKDATPVRHTTGFAPGFAGMKAMALISQTAQYETFLMTWASGALYTVRIPLTQPMKPVLTKVRSSSWQGFETLIAARCGKGSTLLLGIDKNTTAGYLYAVGHANGTATAIKGLGKVPGLFPDPVDFRWNKFSDPVLAGD